MEFRINDIPFLNFNYQFEKELHNKEGKPNQKCSCYWECGKIFDYEILSEWKDIFTLKNETSNGKVDFLTYNPKNRNFYGTLPSSPIGTKSCSKYQNNAEIEIDLLFEVDNKKLFNMLYKDKKITINFKAGLSPTDIQNIDLTKINLNGDIEIVLNFANGTDFMLWQQQGSNAQYTTNPVTIKTDSSIFNLDIKNLIDHLDIEDLYIITKKENYWKYKIDVQNYNWIMKDCDLENCQKYCCDYPETEDLPYVNFRFMSNDIDISNPIQLTWEILTGKMTFEVKSKRIFTIWIVENHSANPSSSCLDEKRVCSKGSKYHDKIFALDEELPVNKIKYQVVLGRKE
jgi:hypothetical protein